MLVETSGHFVEPLLAIPPAPRDVVPRLDRPVPTRCLTGDLGNLRIAGFAAAVAALAVAAFSAGEE